VQASLRITGFRRFTRARSSSGDANCIAAIERIATFLRPRVTRRALRHRTIGSRRMKAGAGAARVDESPSHPNAKRVVASLRRMGSARGRAAMARYALPSEKAFGVSVASIQALAKRLGRSHELAEDSGTRSGSRARMLAAFVDEPGRVTAAQMDRWTRDFDNWASATRCASTSSIGRRTAFRKVAAWARRRPEFERRAAFALLASLAAHDRAASDEAFERCLPLIEECAGDDRNFVKKGVSWALRMVGRRSVPLHAKSLALARRLADSEVPCARWIGREALRDLASPRSCAALKANAPRPRA
jgi:3-methyladenine DNA glycosylase AlkD